MQQDVVDRDTAGRRQTWRTWGCLLLALHLTITGLAFLVERHQLGQPRQQGQVVAVTPTGSSRGCGRRCHCPAAEVEVQVPGRVLHGTGCLDDHREGDVLTVRAVRVTDRAQLDPEPTWVTLVVLPAVVTLSVAAGLARFRRSSGRGRAAPTTT